jgi:hypothetical protein
MVGLPVIGMPIVRSCHTKPALYEFSNLYGLSRVYRLNLGPAEPIQRTSDTPIHQSVALSLVGGGSRRTRGYGLATQAKTEPTQQEPYNMCRNTGCSPPTSTKPRRWVPMGVLPSYRPAWSKFGETRLIRFVALHYSQTPTCGCAHIQR